MLAAFDLDGTLVDQVAAARAWTRELVETWDLPQSTTDEIAPRLSERRPKGPLFDEIVAQWKLPIDGDTLATAYRQRMPQLVRCTDADKEALRRLRRSGWTIGIVTNGTVLNQEGKIRATGLDELVDGWVVSEVVGARKPEPGIFEALGRRANCDLRGWMIGDGFEHDIAGGAAVGLSTAWISQPEQLTSDGPQPTICAPTVAKAVDRINRDLGSDFPARPHLATSQKPQWTYAEHHGEHPLRNSTPAAIQPHSRRRDHCGHCAPGPLALEQNHDVDSVDILPTDFSADDRTSSLRTPCPRTLADPHSTRLLPERSRTPGTETARGRGATAPISGLRAWVRTPNLFRTFSDIECDLL